MSNMSELHIEKMNRIAGLMEAFYAEWIEEEPDLTYEIYQYVLDHYGIPNERV